MKGNAGEFGIIVHGGAYAIPKDLKETCELGCRSAAQAGYAVLAAGGTALDAVEAAIISLENNPCFDAGFGSVLTLDSKVEMDAVIMDGKTLNAGAVACVSSVRNPISLARKVMEKTNHVLIVGAGADTFARKMGFEEVGADDLTTDATRAELALYMQEEDPYGASVSSDFNRPNADKLRGMGHDTTGCVCIDSYGNICAGTSTGGITAKISGRVGDSPIIGSGAYCDDRKGGVSTTGHGESIMKVCLAKNAIDIMSNPAGNASPQDALCQALAYMKERVGGCGGMIAISSAGEVAKAFTTTCMSWASIEAKRDNCNYNGNTQVQEVRLSGIEPDENNSWSV